MSVRRVVFFAFTERYGAMGLKLISIPILARLLSPEEIGVFSIGMAAVVLAHMLRDFGIPTYIIQEKKLTREKVSASYGLALAVGWSLGLIIFFSSGPLGDFFEEPGVENIISMLAINFFLIPLGSMAPSLLKRNMCFGTVAKINLISSLTGTSTTLSFAFSGYSYMSLVYGSIAGVTMTAVLSQYFMPSNYRVWPSTRGWKNILNISGYSMGGNVIREIASAIIDMMIGKIMGFAMLGLYSRALGYFKIYHDSFQKAVGRVVQSLLAKSNREGVGTKTNYNEAIAYVTVFAWPALAVMALMAFPIFRILFGSQWDMAIAPAQLICVGGMFNVIAMTNHRALLGVGLVKESFNVILITQALRLVVVIALIPHGLTALVAGVASIEVVGAILSSRYLFIFIGESKQEFFFAVKKSIIITSLVLVVPAIVFVMPQVDPFENSLYFLIGVISAIVVWVVGVIKTKHNLSGEVVSLYGMMRKRLSSSTDSGK